MKWTAEKPTEPGLYLHRTKIFEGCWTGPDLYRIDLSENGTLRIFDGTFTEDSQWAGPIPEPEE